MELDRLEQARFPYDPSHGFGERVLASARLIPRDLTPPTLLPEILDGIGWAAAVWLCAAFFVHFL